MLAWLVPNTPIVSEGIVKPLRLTIDRNFSYDMKVNAFTETERLKTETLASPFMDSVQLL